MLKFFYTFPYLGRQILLQCKKNERYITMQIMFIWTFGIHVCSNFGLCTNFHQVFFFLQRNSVFSELHKLCHLSRVLYALLIHSDISCKKCWPYKILACDVWSCKILARYVWDVRILQDPCKKCPTVHLGLLHYFKNWELE